jgi:arylformamidase
MPPATDAPLVLAVGEKEPRGFHLQRELMRERWRPVITADVTCPGRHHFDVLDDLITEGAPLFSAAMKLMGHG